MILWFVVCCDISINVPRVSPLRDRPGVIEDELDDIARHQLQQLLACGAQDRGCLAHDYDGVERVLEIQADLGHAAHSAGAQLAAPLHVGWRRSPGADVAHMLLVPVQMWQGGSGEPQSQ